MFVLGARHAEVRHGGLRIVQRVLRLDYRYLGANPGFILCAGIVKRLLIVGRGLTINRL